MLHYSYGVSSLTSKCILKEYKMQRFGFVKWLIVAVAVVMMTACGGGGGETPQ